MSLGRFINYDGRIIRSNTPLVTIPEFLSWDHYANIDIRVSKEGIIYSQEIWTDLIRKSGILGIEIPATLLLHQRFEREVLRTAQQNDCEDGIFKITIFPEKHYSIELTSTPINYWELKREGWWINIMDYSDMLTLPYWYRHHKVWEPIKKVALEMGFDSFLITNKDEEIIEMLHGGFFYVQNKQLYYVGDPLHMNAISQQIVNHYAFETGKIIHQLSVPKETIITADEIFRFDNARGLQWVLAIEQRRYFSMIGKQIFRWLYQRWEKKATKQSISLH